MAITDTSEKNRRDCYLGNIKIKRQGVEQSYTKEQVEELIKCRDDIIYFISNYVKIVDLDKGLVLFEPFEYQKDMIRIMEENRYSIHMLPRQFGKSTIVAAYLLHHILFTDRAEVAILANKADQSREILGRLQLMYEELPWFMQPGVAVWNKGDIKLGNGSKAFCAATTGGSIRGRSISLLYLDEMAHIQNDVAFFTSVYPTITSGKNTKVIITSTPNGMNLFYKIWTDAKLGRNGFKCKQVHWSEHPRRTEEWKEEQLKTMSERQFNQEFLLEFLGSTNTLISGTKLQHLNFTEPTFLDDERLFSVHENSVEGDSYVVTVDVAEGVGGDYSVISVFNVTEKPYRHIAVFRSNEILPLALADMVFKIATEYNNAIVIVESNNSGVIVGQSLWFDFEYENLLTTKIERGENQEYGGKRMEYGVRTTKRTKMLGCTQLKGLIETNTLLVQNFETISELTTFIRKGSSYEAERGKNDDIVMTLVLFAWFTSQAYFTEMTETNVRQVVIDALRDQDGFAGVMCFFDDGTDF